MAVAFKTVKSTEQMAAQGASENSVGGPAWLQYEDRMTRLKYTSLFRNSNFFISLILWTQSWKLGNPNLLIQSCRTSNAISLIFLFR